MKKFLSPFVMVCSLLVLAVNLHSQAVVPKPPGEQLKVIKAKNIELLEQQKQTLLKLEEMEKQADQIRILAKRS